MMRVKIVWLTGLLLGLLAIGAQAQSPQATLTFEEPVYVNCPVWVYINIVPMGDPEVARVQANMRYPFSDQPADFRGHSFEVMKEGELLPRIEGSKISGMIIGGALGSAAPPTSPQHRFPLHVLYRFDRPGEYQVRYTYKPWLPSMPSPEISSDWTTLVVQPDGEARQAWRKSRLAVAPADIGLLVGDYLPNLLAQPDESALEAIISYLYHDVHLVQDYAGNSLGYFPDELLLRRIPQAVAEKGSSDYLAHYFAPHQKLFEPLGEKLVEAIIPYLQSDSPARAGAAVQTLLFMRRYASPPGQDLTAQSNEAIWQASGHIMTFSDGQALQPFCLFLGQNKSDRSRTLLWQLTRKAVRGQALICLCWVGDSRDLPKLGRLLLTNDPHVGSLPYHMLKAWGDKARPYLWTALKDAPNKSVRMQCLRQLALENRTENYISFKQILEQKQDDAARSNLMSLLYDYLGLPGNDDASDAKVIAFLDKEIKAAGGG